MDTQVLVVASHLHQSVKQALAGAGIEANTANTLPQTLHQLRRGSYDAVLIDARRTMLDALELVLNIRDVDAAAPIIVYGAPAHDANGRALRGQPNLTCIERGRVEQLARHISQLEAGQAVGG